MLSYFITSSDYPIQQTFKAIKTYKPDFVCYRNKKYFNLNEIIEFAKFAKKYSKIFINYDDLKDEKLLKYFDGIHFPTSKMDLAKKYHGKIKIASTHSIKEVKKAKNLGFDYITFSPVFNSKGRDGLGIEKLNEICEIFPNTIALGGIISEKEIKEIEKSKAIGFGSIRYFLRINNEK
ncbi:thiamine-phosphate pyrophosphorylase [Lebetimonas natsushimae]|uniref:Thiamine-phosphate pyrophosphorylase n=1 Tax=Lebetimonas natsushimae TaxID=1936991 RepID=A0A292YEX4_9BACT|nr:thiamine phosphate synthase [Lebetimonas natsushimae]GAX87660.1 thiamine-phosphate pyrophosphorylase [Lebetimonas natsushimae]